MKKPNIDFKKVKEIFNRPPSESKTLKKDIKLLKLKIAKKKLQDELTYYNKKASKED